MFKLIYGRKPDSWSCKKFLTRDFEIDMDRCNFGLNVYSGRHSFGHSAFSINVFGLPDSSFILIITIRVRSLVELTSIIR